MFTIYAVDIISDDSNWRQFLLCLAVKSGNYLVNLVDFSYLLMPVKLQN